LLHEPSSKKPAICHPLVNLTGQGNENCVFKDGLIIIFFEVVLKNNCFAFLPFTREMSAKNCTSKKEWENTNCLSPSSVIPFPFTKSQKED